jgi:hypothetical protein
MFGSVKVFCRVLVLGRIAASDVAAHQAHPQVDPRVAHLQAFFATIRARLYIFNFFYVRACILSGHCILPSNSFISTTVVKRSQREAVAVTRAVAPSAVDRLFRGVHAKLTLL